MFGTQALPPVGELARKADATVPYAYVALNEVPLIAPAYGETTIQLDDSLGADSMQQYVCPYVAAHMWMMVRSKSCSCSGPVGLCQRGRPPTTKAARDATNQTYTTVRKGAQAFDGPQAGLAHSRAA